ncbi:hypothetical protein ABH926_004721 [Catenulispora sp. GP43]|uniref:hypothetical protein n=1 Tax=Catenulispora sp. GP43 TaxID=3156263 RepID=UPI003516F788
MGSLIAGMLDGLGIPSGLAGDTTPYVPSAPVQIGTSGPRHGAAEAGSWQGLLAMFALVLVLGAAVLLYVVRQRTRVLARRRVRRMGEAAALMAELEAELAAGLDAGLDAEMETQPATRLAPQLETAPPHTTHATHGRAAPNA